MDRKRATCFFIVIMAQVAKCRGPIAAWQAGGAGNPADRGLRCPLLGIAEASSSMPCRAAVIYLRREENVVEALQKTDGCHQKDFPFVMLVLSRVRA